MSKQKEKPWENPKKFKVLLVTPTDSYLCAGDTDDELHLDIYEKMVENKIETIEMGFGWMGTMPMIPAFAREHIHRAIDKYIKKEGVQ